MKTSNYTEEELWQKFWPYLDREAQVEITDLFNIPKEQKPAADADQADQKREPEAKKESSAAGIARPEEFAGLNLKFLRDITSQGKDFKAEMERLVGHFAQGEPNAGLIIKANWARSPLYQLYLAMGRQSMSLRRQVGDIAAEWLKAGKVALSEEEFKQVADVSRYIQQL